MKTQFKTQFLLVMLLLAVFSMNAFGTVPSSVAIGIDSNPKPQPAFVNENVLTTLIASFYGGDPIHELDPPSNTQYTWSCPTITRDGIIIVQDSQSLVQDAPAVSFFGGKTTTMTFNSSVKGIFVCTVKLVATSPDWRDANGNQITLNGTCAVTIIVTDVRLKQVIFGGSGFHSILEDVSQAAYGSPQWLDLNHDGDADENNENHFPLSYLHGSDMTATALFDVSNGAQLPSPLKVRCTSSAKVTFPDTTAQVNRQTITASMTSNTGLPNAAVYYNPFRLTWSISKDNGKTWIFAGTSDNRLYVTLGNPGSKQESIFDIASRNLSGEMTDKSQIVDTIWSAFKGPMPGLHRKVRDGHNQTDNKEMKYWPEGFNTPGNFTAPALISSGEGRCGSWADLLIQALNVHGITSTNEGITPPQWVPAGYTAKSPWNSFNPWWLCVDGSHPGQGNATPTVSAPDQGIGLPTRFNDHAVVRITNPAASTVYDPSYALTFKNPNNPSWDGSRLQWDDSTVKNFVVWATNGGPILAIEYWNNIGQIDTIWAP